MTVSTPHPPSGLLTWVAHYRRTYVVGLRPTYSYRPLSLQHWLPATPSQILSAGLVYPLRPIFSLPPCYVFNMSRHCHTGVCRGVLGSPVSIDYMVIQ